MLTATLDGAAGSVLGSIPSPPNSNLVIGPFTIHYYGAMIALGVLAAVMFARHRWQARGGNPDDISNLALIAVPAGLIGARIYHVATDYQRTYCGPPNCARKIFWDAFKVWDGGLGIPGGIALGVIVGVIYARRMRINLRVGFDAVAPALPLAQGIGRLGNWFNQELFGRPTSLPWGLKIDQLHRPAQYKGSETFHPTFLYELVWNLGVVALILVLDRRGRLKAGKLFPIYIGGYFLGRMWIEEMRSDQAAMIGSFRWNFLLSVIMVVVSAVWFFAGGFRRGPDDPYPNAYVDVGGDRPADDLDKDVALVAAALSGGEGGVGEQRPDLQGPGAESAAAEPDEGAVGVGIEPPEATGPTEVPERPG